MRGVWSRSCLVLAVGGPTAGRANAIAEATSNRYIETVVNMLVPNARIVFVFDDAVHGFQELTI
jgi:hypothetical protein